MKKLLYIAMAALGTIQAQQPVAPTTEQIGSARGENSGNYNITNSFEFGYRWSLVGGDLGEYRSDVNYRNGLRLLSSSLSVDSKDGHGRYFDQILLNTQGLGNDPYQSAALRIQKNGLYRYDMNWRLNDYFNPGLTVAGGLHRWDTVRRWQDHDLTLLPQSHYRLRLGYSRNTQNGPALTTSEEFDNSSTGLPIFANIRREWDEYRIGGDIEFAGFRFTVLRRWDYYKEDTPYSLLGVVSAASVGSPNDLTVLQQFSKSAPVHGRNPGWLGNLTANHKRWATNARISYTSGHNFFALGETASGISRFGTAANRQIVVRGDAERPMLNGDFNFSLFPTTRLTIVNNTSVSNLRIAGPSSYTEVVNGSNSGETLFFRFLGIRLVTNSTDLNYRVRPWVGFYAGYSYTDRQVHTIEGFSLPAFPGSANNGVFDTANHLHSGVAGVRFRPVKPLSASVETEIGRADHPLTPVSDRNYHSLGGRVEYRTRKLQLSTQYRQFYSVNSPIPLSAYSSHSRNYTASASWAPQNWFSLDASYMKLHLDSISGIAFFAGLPRQTLQSANSWYESNVHAANLGTRIAVLKRADFFLGYSITKDTGGAHIPQNTVAADLLNSVQTFPLSYQSPMARLSIRISPKVRWNAGYQFYNYHEDARLFSYYQNFHAHTGFTSVMWMF